MMQSGACVIRRLIMPDIEALCRLYAQAPKDFEWVCSEELTSCFMSGEIWGVFEGKCLLCAVPAVPLNARTVLCGSLRPQIPQDMPQKTFVIYPAVGSENIDEKTLLSLLENCTARCLTHRHADAIIATVPVKSCPGLSAW
ncbi:MAG: hypothetical protein PHG02_08095, partial [Oscillospiraceae bacterium]|nr:hypothetical protein [Oscillospiraceae bacterium]